jgi:hypothetical protein
MDYYIIQYFYQYSGEDLKGFKPNMYRLMQRSQTPLRIGLMYNHVFEQERNRVQFIADWPTGNDANIISSLQVKKSCYIQYINSLCQVGHLCFFWVFLLY